MAWRAWEILDFKEMWELPNIKKICKQIILIYHVPLYKNWIKFWIKTWDGHCNINLLSGVGGDKWKLEHGEYSKRFWLCLCFHSFCVMPSLNLLQDSFCFIPSFLDFLVLTIMCNLAHSSIGDLQNSLCFRPCLLVLQFHWSSTYVY